MRPNQLWRINLLSSEGNRVFRVLGIRAASICLSNLAITRHRPIMNRDNVFNARPSRKCDLRSASATVIFCNYSYGAARNVHRDLCTNHTNVFSHRSLRQGQYQCLAQRPHNLRHSVARVTCAIRIDFPDPRQRGPSTPRTGGGDRSSPATSSVRFFGRGAYCVSGFSLLVPQEVGRSRAFYESSSLLQLINLPALCVVEG